MPTITPGSGRLELTARPPLVSVPDLTPAIAGVARSGVTTSGVTSATRSTAEEPFVVLIHDDIRTRHVDIESLSIDMGINDEASKLSATIIPRGRFDIHEGHDVQVWMGGVESGRPLFGGTILQADHQSTRLSDPVDCQIEATDYRWLLDKHARVSATYYSQGINTIVRSLLDDFVDPAAGFAIGYVPASLGTIDEISFDNVTVSSALSRLRTYVDGGGFWAIELTQAGTKRISLYDEPDDEGNALTLEDGQEWFGVQIGKDQSQAKNRVVVLGGGSATTALVSANATTIPVEETLWYDPAGSTVRAGRLDVTYAGLDMQSGPGSLTGCTGITQDIPQGTTITVRSQADDTTAQTAMAARLGTAGIVVHQESIQGATYAETALRAASRLDELATPNTDITITQAPLPLKYSEDYPSAATGLHEWRPGRTVAVNLSRPVCVQGTFRIRGVGLSYRSNRRNGEPVFARTVNMARVVSRSNETLALMRRAATVEGA